MMTTTAQRRAYRRYCRKALSFVVRVNPDTEPDVYERLYDMENRAGYVKQLVRSDIARGSK